MLENKKFFKLYKFLFDKEFKETSSEAKIIYSIMIERNNLSIINSLKDNKGYYIIMKNTEIQDILNCGKQKAINILNELEQANLIERKRQGLNKPNLIYLNTYENDTLTSTKTELQEIEQAYIKEYENHTQNNTNINKIDINKTDIKSGALAPDNKIYSIPLKNGVYYNLYDKHIELYKTLYPNINVEQEIKNIIGWNLANVNKRKTLKGIQKHINFWLQRANNNAIEKDNINFKQKDNRYEPNYSKNDFFNADIRR